MATIKVVQMITFHGYTPKDLDESVNEWFIETQITADRYINSNFNFDGKRYWQTIIYSKEVKVQTNPYIAPKHIPKGDTRIDDNM